MVGVLRRTLLVLSLLLVLTGLGQAQWDFSEKQLGNPQFKPRDSLPANNPRNRWRLERDQYDEKVQTYRSQLRTLQEDGDRDGYRKLKTEFVEFKQDAMALGMTKWQVRNQQRKAAASKLSVEEKQQIEDARQKKREHMADMKEQLREMQQNMDEEGYRKTKKQMMAMRGDVGLDKNTGLKEKVYEQAKEQPQTQRLHSKKRAFDPRDIVENFKNKVSGFFKDKGRRKP